MRNPVVQPSAGSCFVLLERVEISSDSVIKSPPIRCVIVAERELMDLAQQAKIIDSIHDALNEYVGQRLRVRANMGRSKIVESDGVLTQVHPRLFIMEMDRKRGRTARQSYQFVDVLTGTVELSQNGEPLFEPFIIEPEAESLPVPMEGDPNAETAENTETIVSASSAILDDLPETIG